MNTTAICIAFPFRRRQAGLPGDPGSSSPKDYLTPPLTTSQGFFLQPTTNQMAMSEGRSTVLALETIWTASAMSFADGSSLVRPWDEEGQRWREGVVFWPQPEELQYEGDDRIAEITRRRGRRQPEAQSRKDYRRCLPLLRYRDLYDDEGLHWSHIDTIVEPKPLDATWGSRSRVPDFEGIWYPVEEIPVCDEVTLLGTELLNALSDPESHLVARSAHRSSLRIDTSLPTLTTTSTWSNSAEIQQRSTDAYHLPTPPHRQSGLKATAPEWTPSGRLSAHREDPLKPAQRVAHESFASLFSSSS